MTTTRRRALVTGASAGIGAAFARVLAARGHDLVLTARRQDRLEALAIDLRAAHHIDVRVVQEDLSDAAACERLVSALSARGVTVDVLINNAGYGVPGRYAATSWDEQQRFLQVLVVAVTELTHRLLPGMIGRGYGRIVNVASLAGLLPGVAGHTLYPAAKAFLIKFSESLAQETRPHNVHVTASCPGFTRSEFHDVTGTREQVNTLPAFMWLDAERVARESCDAVDAGEAVYVPGGVNRTLALLGRLLPRSVATAMVSRNAKRFRRV